MERDQRRESQDRSADLRFKVRGLGGLAQRETLRFGISGMTNGKGQGRESQPTRELVKRALSCSPHQGKARNIQRWKIRKYW